MHQAGRSWRGITNCLLRRHQAVLGISPLLQRCPVAFGTSDCRSFTASVYGLRRLRQLEEEANRHPGDSSRQLALMQACNKQNYGHVAVRRFESGHYASDDAVVKEYIRALSLTNQLSRLSLSTLTQSISQTAGVHGAPPGDFTLNAEQAAAAMAGGVSSARGTQEMPLHVQWHESPRAQVWKLLRSLALAGVVAAVLYNVVDDKALPKGLGFSSAEVQPVVGSPKRFGDVVGVDEAINELRDIVKYLRSPKQFTRLGGKLPKGVLLTGPPGTGKTLLARAVAGEAGVPFFYMSGSEFEEVFVGVGAKRVRELFSAAKKRAPCIVFIDEIDAIGSHRNPKEQQAMKMTLNQLLVEMDGFQQNTGVIVLGATNFPEALDRALVRPGRFDTHVVVPLPDVRGRKQILDLYGKPIPLETDVNLDTIARATPGFSGADLSNLMNVAALKASQDEKKKVGMVDLEYASDKIRMGAERKSAVISPENLKLTAYHEGGHALVAMHTPGAMPIHKATIVPRGSALGMVSYLPEKDQMNMTREQMYAHMDVCMGGRVAEELIFGRSSVTTGASSDLQQATSTARNMITKYGMSDSIGPVYHSDDQLDKLSTCSRELVEQEVRSLLIKAEANAKRILMDHNEKLHKLAQGLLEYESLTISEIQDVLAGRPPKPAAQSDVSSGEAKQASPAEGVKEKAGRKAAITSLELDGPRKRAHGN